MAHSSSPVILTVDAVIMDDHGRVLLMERGTEPFRGTWVLPGGLVDPGETVEQAVVREVLEELGLTVAVVRLIGVFSTPGRDPRGSFVSLAFHVRITGGEVAATEEAPAHRWLASGEQVSMGFDHADILQVFRGQ
jgi:8-oxo-dGTP diphosphatase